MKHRIVFDASSHEQDSPSLNDVLEIGPNLLPEILATLLYEATGFDSEKATIWSDSTVVLGWIRKNPNKWKTFVCNRVTEIHQYTTPNQWRHCPGEQNPADHLTRGLTEDELRSLETWWCGPDWLTRTEDCWPQDTTAKNTQLPEAKRTIQVNVINIDEPLLDVFRFSSYWKLLHVTAWILRFVTALKTKAKFPNTLAGADLQTARTYWIKRVQKERFSTELSALERGEQLPGSSKIARYIPFLNDGIIRLGGRLQCAQLSYEQRHPAILDGDHQFTRLLIKQTHIRLHHLGVRIVLHLGVQIVLSELREEFCILRARQIIKKVIHSCLPCKIARSTRLEETEAPLPLDRVKLTKPFSVKGVEFAGPLYIRSGNTIKKSYIALFTCTTTPALYLEFFTDTVCLQTSFLWLCRDLRAGAEYHIQCIPIMHRRSSQPIRN